MARLADDDDQFNARFEPVNATYAGDNRFDDQLGLSIAPSERTRRVAATTRLSKAGRVSIILTVPSGTNNWLKVTY